MRLVGDGELVARDREPFPCQFEGVCLENDKPVLRYTSFTDLPSRPTRSWIRLQQIWSTRAPLTWTNNPLDNFFESFNLSLDDFKGNGA